LGVLSAGLLVLFLPSVARGADAPAEKPLATEKIDHDCIVEVTDIYRGSDGLLEVNWRYRNPTSERVQLMSSGEARELMNEVYIIDAGQKKKYHVATVEAAKGKSHTREDQLASQTEEIDLPPGQSAILWAKFPRIDEKTSEISVYLPNSPPLEDLPIQKHEQAQPAAATEGGALAKQPHQSGATIEVTRVRRSSDGTVDVRWRYVNQGKEPIELLSSSQARELPKQAWVMDPDKKMRYGVATDDRKQPLAGKLSDTKLDPGKSLDVWMKFPADASAKRITLMIPGAVPIEDLPITERNAAKP
jgi:hypothetical protein